MSDIEDVLDGAKPMTEALENNIENLTRQMQELKGALSLCRKMQENGEQIETFDAEKYWNAVEEEERKGNRFMDIARDVVRFEKTTLMERFGIEHRDGKMVDEFPKALLKIVGMTFGYCFFWCLLDWSFSMETLKEAASMFLSILIVEVVVAIPTYFILKKHPEIKKKDVQFWMPVIIFTIITVAVIIKILIK